MTDLNELARKKDLFIDNAATASQNKSLVDDPVTREAIELNIIAPLILAISERDTEIDRLKASLPPVDAEAIAITVDRAEAAEAQLGDLLAIIHRDGGQYQETHGTEKAVNDAHQIWADLMSKAEEAEAEVARLKAELAEAHRVIEDAKTYRKAAVDAWNKKGTRPMSVPDRDVIAAFALQGMLAHSTRYRPRPDAPSNWHEAIAEEAYQIADAMLKMRNKTDE